MPQLPPGTPFKSERKGIFKRGQRLARKVGFEDLPKTPAEDAVEVFHLDHLNGAKLSHRAAHTILNRRSNNQGNVMEFGERCRMRICDKRNADIRRVTIRR